ncbi:MAG: DUF2497 domain-containing protein [Alphaproteobacteria bacterium]|nr:DUF2497 domain-containing protein [Alphaproteobacteria bacterium]
MAEEKDTEQEPSIEEILASIRQIISDDDEEEAGVPDEPQDDIPAEPEPAPEPDTSAEAEDDIVELTDKVDEEPEPVAEPESVEIDMRDPEEEAFESEPESEVVPEPTPEPEPESQIKAAPVEEDLESILTGNAENAAYEGFAELARKTAVEHGGITLEEIVRTELKPLLRGWLDKNLPSMIERLVQEELERVAKRALDE